MENMIQVFENKEFGKVRTVAINDEPWFVGKDVASILGYRNPNEAIQDHVDVEDKFMRSQRGSEMLKLFSSIKEMQEKLGRQDSWFISESGVYSLIFGSKLPNAKKFKHWVTSDVLPAIRKTGTYSIPKDYPSALRALADQCECNQKLMAENKAMKPKALFADAVKSSKTSILVGELAKLIKQNGVEIGEKRLFTWLRDNGYLMSRKCSDWNMPTQKSMELGLFEINERNAFNPDGSVRITKTPRVTGKGQTYFINKFLSGKAA